MKCVLGLALIFAPVTLVFAEETVIPENQSIGANPTGQPSGRRLHEDKLKRNFGFSFLHQEGTKDIFQLQAVVKEKMAAADKEIEKIAKDKYGGDRKKLKNDDYEGVLKKFVSDTGLMCKAHKDGDDKFRTCYGQWQRDSAVFVDQAATAIEKNDEARFVLGSGNGILKNGKYVQDAEGRGTPLLKIAPPGEEYQEINRREDNPGVYVTKLSDIQAEIANAPQAAAAGGEDAKRAKHLTHVNGAMLEEWYRSRDYLQDNGAVQAGADDGPKYYKLEELKINPDGNDSSEAVVFLKDDQCGPDGCVDEENAQLKRDFYDKQKGNFKADKAVEDARKVVVQASGPEGDQRDTGWQMSDIYKTVFAAVRKTIVESVESTLAASRNGGEAPAEVGDQPNPELMEYAEKDVVTANPDATVNETITFALNPRKDVRNRLRKSLFGDGDGAKPEVTIEQEIPGYTQEGDEADDATDQAQAAAAAQTAQGAGGSAAGIGAGQPDVATGNGFGADPTVSGGGF